MKPSDKTLKKDNKKVFLQSKFQFGEALKQLDEISKTQDRLPEEPFPNEIVEHLKLNSYYDDKKKSPEKVSAPKGFLPRINLDHNRPIAKGIMHEKGVSLIDEKNSDLTHFPSYLPSHLGVKSVLSTVSRKFRSGVTPMENKIQVIGANMDMFPWSCIGRIVVYLDGKSIKTGTGFMVGPNLLMTASHVMPWEHDGKCSIVFTPGYHPHYEPPFGSTTVSDWYGVPHDGFWDIVFQSDASDIVICRTNDPIGNICGWLGTKSFGNHDKYFNHFYNSLGYPDFANGYPTCEFLATIRDVDGDKNRRELETENFGGPGWSGGPLFSFIDNDWRAVGVCHGFETEFVFGIPPWNTNLVFAGGKWMVDLVNYGYNHYNY